MLTAMRGSYSLVLLAVSALFCTGCSPSTRSSGRPDAVDESLRPQIDRFRIALGARAGQPVQPDSAEMRLFTAALGATVNDHVDPVDSEKLVDAAIASLDRPASATKAGDVGSLVDTAIAEMISSLDRHGAYLYGDLYQELEGATAGRFGGVGLEITMRNGAVTVVSPIEDGPAARAGIRPGDQLLAIDDVPMEGSSLVDAIRHLRGPVGAEVTLKIRRADVSQPLLQVLTREEIHIPGVRFLRVTERCGYVRISQFGERTAVDLDRALRSLQQAGAFDGLVLDLRNNPGGLLSQAVHTAQMFLGSGVVLSTRGRAPKQTQTFYAKGEGEWHRIPMIVLVDHGSAAGSEVVAAALKGNQRAQLVGSRTFGNGWVQTIIPIGQQAALRLTTARMYGPIGASLELELEPDVTADPESSVSNVPSAKDPIVAEAVQLLGNVNVP